MARLAAVMAHPDDVEFQIGGTLLRLRSLGWELAIVTMTAGDCGSPNLRSEEISRIRYAEASASATILGASYSCAGLMDVEVFTNADNLRKVVEILRRLAPDVVITHSQIDYMLDHEETSRLVRGATFALAMPNYQTRQGAPAPPTRGIPALYYADPMEGIDHFNHRVHPDFYVDISAELDGKLALLTCHSSQREWLQTHHGIEYLDRATHWAESSGRECGFVYAEGLRQHLGHGYPREPLLQMALAPGISQRGTLGRPAQPDGPDVSSRRVRH